MNDKLLFDKDKRNMQLNEQKISDIGISLRTANAFRPTKILLSHLLTLLASKQQQKPYSNKDTFIAHD